ncbi:hypothetical protein HY483_03190 [Candidatus Woesearchaeota archaeon]|nr:hypothetical protein [Candidatus Woesearchaeota archaeon]
MDKRKVGMFVILNVLFLIMLAVYVYAVAPVITLSTTATTPGNNTIIAGTRFISLTTDTAANVTYTIMNFTGGNVTTNLTNSSATGHNFTWVTTNGSYPYGVYNITIRATNQTDTSEYTTIANVTVDNLAPNVTTTNPSSSANLSGSINITANITDNSPFRSVLYSIMNKTNGELLANLSATQSGNVWSTLWVTLNNATFPDGVYNISINATDTVNNSNYSASTIGSLTIDNTAPVIKPLTPAQSSNITAGTNTINVTVTDATTAVVSVTFFVFNSSGNLTQTLSTTSNGSNYTASWNTSNTTLYVDGVYNISVNASDTLNNIRYNTSVIRVSVDNTMPSATFLTPAASANISGNATINVTITDVTTQVNVVTFRIVNSAGAIVYNATPSQGGNNYSFTWATANGTYADGTYNISVVSNDTVGNSNTTIRTVTVDNTAPVAPTPVRPANTANLSGSVNVSVTVTDATSGVSTVQFGIVNSSGATAGTWLNASRAGDAWSATWTTTSFADGTYNVSVNITDSAGNLRSNTSVMTAVVVDNTAPAITGQLATASTTALSLTVTWNASELVNGTLRYGTSSSGLPNSSGVTTFRNNHTVTITGLEDTTLYYYNITGCDNAGNCNTSGPFNATTNHVADRGSGSGTSSATSSSATTVTISTLNTVGATVARTFTTVNEKVTLANLPGTLGTHSVTYKSADESTKTVTVEVASTPKTLQISLGGSEKVDLNDDNTYDLLVTLTSFVTATNFQLKFEVLDSTQLVTPVVASAETTSSAASTEESKDVTAPAPEEKKTGTSPTGGAATTAEGASGGLGGGTWAIILIIVLLAGWFGWKKLGRKK